MPQTPALLISTLVALVYGTTYYLFRGKRLADLPVFLLAALLGFTSGWLAGMLLDLLPPTMGEIHLVEASLASALFLVAADWLRTRGPD
jgi:thiamine transporter ThiT